MSERDDQDFGVEPLSAGALAEMATILGNDIREAVALFTDIMQPLPDAFCPEETMPFVSDGEIGLFDEKPILADERNVVALRAVYERQPKGAANLFRNISAIIGYIFIEAQMLPRLGGAARFKFSEGNPLSLVLAAAQMLTGDKEETSGAGQALAGKISQEVARMVRPAPNLEAVVTTFLGTDSAEWLCRKSELGYPNIQFHEATRVNWIRLFQIDGQVALENEIRWLSEVSDELAKTLVCALWLQAGLMSIVDPALFVGEHDTYLSRSIEGDATMSRGIDTHNILRFGAARFRLVALVLRSALDNPDIEAVDLLWAAAALAEVGAPRPDEPALRHGVRIARPSCDIFLSHRGIEAKAALLAAELGAGEHANFLDCLAVPAGLTNRHFLYSYLARSRVVLTIETPHFADSAWCRRERWFAQELQRHGEASHHSVETLAEALDWIAARRSQAISPPRPDDEGVGQAPGWTSNRILRDLDYWARKPNLEELEKSGADVAPFREFSALLGGGVQPPDEGMLASSDLRDAIVRLRERVEYGLAGATLGRVVTGVINALSLCEAAFLLFEEKQYNKMRARRMMDNLRRCFLSLEQLYDRHPDMSDDRLTHSAWLAAAFSSELGSYRTSRDLEWYAARTFGPNALMRRGVVLVDMRDKELRDFHLEFLALAAQKGIGAVGMIQSHDDTIHECLVNGFAFSSFPCVTVHPGMETEFPALGT